MCGILAIVSEKAPISPETMERALNRIHHRGPDGSGTWLADGRNVGLGHKRLSIIDLETGAQPIANEDETVRIVVNGEFYEFEKHRAALEAKGHRFRTGSDSEIALHLYEEYGAHCLQYLRGEFAFILWDGLNRRIFAARDRFGIKPLYYAHVNGTLFLASEVKALLAAGVSPAWDPETVMQNLFLFPDLDRTLFKRVYQVPPGCFMLASGEQVRISRYWDLDYPPTGELTPDLGEEEGKGRFLGALTEAVRIRMRADVPVGCFLSGGLDSSAILGLASRCSPDPIRCFTVTFDDEAYNEGPIAEETAEFLGARFQGLPLHGSDFAEHLPDTVAHAETIGINTHAVARYLQCKAVREGGYKVALTGEGSDEILAGYGHSRKDLLQAGSKRAAFDALEPVQRVLGFVPNWLHALAVDRSVFHLFLDSDFAGEYGNRNVYGSFLDQFDVIGQLRGREPVIQSLYLWTRSILPNYILFSDRLEMAHSVETRLPFLDHRLFEEVRTYQPDLLIRNMKEKYILRESLRDRITPRVYNRPKHPFTAPQATLAPGSPLWDLLQDTLRGPSSNMPPFLERDSVISLLNALPNLPRSERLRFDPALMLMLSASLLQSHFGL